MQMLSSDEVRLRWKTFRESKHHREAKPASLVTNSQDATVLFNIAGMQPIVPYLSGKAHPDGKRLYNIQRCVRTNDIDEVGDNTHCTFFEMMGNRSLGDYFKKESLTRSVEFLTDQLGIPFERLGFTIFGGEEWTDGWKPSVDRPPILKDQQAKDILLDMGVSSENIQEVPMINGVKCDNFRGPPGKLGPCGPSCEIYYDKGGEYGPDDKDFVENERRYVEIWNNVFMDRYQDEEGSLTELDQKNIDTGMGFERLMTFLQDKPSMYETDLFAPIVEIIAEELKEMQGLNSGRAEGDTGAEELKAEEPNVETHFYASYGVGGGRGTPVVPHKKGKSPSTDVHSLRIVAEHLRSVVFLLADGVIPSNEGRGYVVRRLIRRLRFHAKNIADKDIVDVDRIAKTFVDCVIKKYQTAYLHLSREQDNIRSFFIKEVEQFERTLHQGQKEFEKHIADFKNNNNRVSGQFAFLLYDTFGFPVELTQELAQGYHFSVDTKGFEQAMDQAKQTSKQASSQKFAKDIDRASHVSGIPATKFVGYESLSCEDANVLKDFVVNNQRVIITDKTPFYAESGGQIGDRGTLIDDEGNELRVVDVKKYEGVRLHIVE